MGNLESNGAQQERDAVLQDGRPPAHAEQRVPLQLLAVSQYLHGALSVDARMCISKDIPLCFARSAVAAPPPPPFSVIPSHDSALTQAERLIVLGCCNVAIVALKLSMRLEGDWQRASESCYTRAHAHMVSIVRRVCSGRASSIAQRFFDEGRCLSAACECAAAAASFRRAIALGHLTARAYLAWLLVNGRGVARSACQSSMEEGAQLAVQGQQMGCSDSAGVLAHCIAKGWGSAQDTDYSLQLALESAAGGSRYGQFVLCADFYSGEEAIAQCHLAAAQGFDEAQAWFGSHHEWRREYEESIRWHTLAADGGNPDSCLFVGKLYYAPNPFVVADKAQAIRYLERARSAGHPITTSEMAAHLLNPGPLPLLTQLGRAVKFW
jgi:TPR repeat protein